MNPYIQHPFRRSNRAEAAAAGLHRAEAAAEGITNRAEAEAAGLHRADDTRRRIPGPRFISTAPISAEETEHYEALRQANLESTRIG